MFQNNIPFIMGFSLGFRTPLKFWESNEPENKSTKEEKTSQIVPLPSQKIRQGQTFNPLSDNYSTLSSSLLNDTSIQLYVKIPL